MEPHELEEIELHSGDDFRLDPPEVVRKWRLVAVILVTALLLAFLSSFLVLLFLKEGAPGNRVIIMIGDGFGPAAATLARIMANRSLVLDQYLIGSVRTSSANSLVTDSAAAATAYACGLKTNNTAVGIDSSGHACATLLEAAKARGWATGLVVTSRLSHATPAAFSAHASSRYEETDITRQQILLRPDVMFGGGMDTFAPLLNLSRQVGYRVVTSLDQATALPVLGLFSPDHLSWVIDREVSDPTPTLAQMTRRALTLLRSASDFFLVIEGSKIDMAAHWNDAAAMVQEVLDFDAAFAEVLNFVKRDINSNILVLVTADHSTGGLTLGSAGWTPGSPPEYRIDTALLQQWKRSAWYIVQEAKKNWGVSWNALTLPALQTEIQKYTGIHLAPEAQDLLFLNRAQTQVLQRQTSEEDVIAHVGYVLSRHAYIGWTTFGHTGEDVNLYAYGNRAKGLGRNVDNTYLNFFIRKQFGLDKWVNRVQASLDAKAKRYVTPTSPARLHD